MYVLGIETSCDDTAAAVIEAKGPPPLGNKNFYLREAQFPKGGGFRVLSNISYSQVAIHKKFGGIVPNLASRAHLERIIPTIKEALHAAKTKPNKIDLIAVTRGPGLMPSLLIGVNTARALAYRFRKPIIGVNHIEGHIYSNWLTAQDSSRNLVRRKKKIEFPALILIVSGGHTELVLMRNYGKYKIIGQTLDDAAGEAFDKTARILGLGFPGGPAIAALADKRENELFRTQRLPIGRKCVLAEQIKRQIKLPRPMINSKDYNFSFSGLKTAVLYLYKGKNKSAMAFEIQEAIVDVLIAKTIKAVKNLNPKTVMIAGGVSANKKLREEIIMKLKPFEIPFLIPDLPYTTDNAAMIAAAGYFSARGGSAYGGNYLKKKPGTDSWKKFETDANLKL